MAFNDYLRILNSDPLFKRFVESELKPKIPEVQTYNPNADNTERWKYDCAMREGFLMCMSILGVKND